MANVERAGTGGTGPVAHRGPRVTVVLPVYQRPEALDDALASVLGHAFDDIEVIVVDDASEQGMRPDIGRFGDERLRLVTREANGGVAAAQNTGLRESRGDLVAFLHSDDRWLPAKLQHQVGLLDDEGEAVIGVESATLRQNVAVIRTAAPRLEGREYEDLLARRVRDLHIAGFLFRRTALEAVGGFDERLRAYEDMDLLLRLRQDHRFLFSHEPVALVDQGGTDRLGTSVWMQRGREHLLEKYHDDLVQTFGELPSGWRDWSLEAGLVALVAGERHRARRHLRRSLGPSRVQRVRRTPLLAAAFGPRRVGIWTASAYRRMSQRRVG